MLRTSYTIVKTIYEKGEEGSDFSLKTQNMF